MKSALWAREVKQHAVAPFAGAWIEISTNMWRKMKFLSLPSRERGLKSVCPAPEQSNHLSLPSRERGLKSPSAIISFLSFIVAPFAGAWIEIVTGPLHPCSCKSLPSRERGLKFKERAYSSTHIWSLPSRERGLKLKYQGIYLHPFLVAPFAGAWIEIGVWSY